MMDEAILRTGMCARVERLQQPGDASMDDASKHEYAKDPIAWIGSVIADGEAPASASKVAWAIATSDFPASDDVPEAWIGTRVLAKKIAMSRFTVMRMVKLLEKLGHLEVKYGKRGRGHSNHYRLVRKGAHSSLFDPEKTQSDDRSKGAPDHLLNPEKVRARTLTPEKVHART
ncbi:hypothetical protein H8A99_03870 [Bradyrhizobium sp. Arg68]|uniref:hypothetical protein n=1 Tax=Bradyrhizobium ivorense TaxID=2511166 RepID=UPI001E47008A|nr:hypothetical protein [Bradyrhizobium ivorense]MCC8935654.1 hypothetical protein [Bradyrhizobium ivorense]